MKAYHRTIRSALEEARKSRCLVAIHQKVDNIDSFDVGMVDAVYKTEAKLSLFAENGTADGTMFARIDSIKRMENGGDYLALVQAQQAPPQSRAASESMSTYETCTSILAALAASRDSVKVCLVGVDAGDTFSGCVVKTTTHALVFQQLSDGGMPYETVVYDMKDVGWVVVDSPKCRALRKLRAWHRSDGEG